MHTQKRFSQPIMIVHPPLGRPGPVGRAFVAIGRAARIVAHHAGKLGILVWGIFYSLVTGRVRPRDIAAQMYWMGVQSLPIVLVTAVLAGVVTSQQGGYQFTGAIPLYVLGSVITSSIVLELGPILTAVVLIGRVGARITAEFGTMKVSEQLDAMHSLGRDPVSVLAAPRVIAGLISVPILVAIANTVGIFSGMLTVNLALGLAPETFLYGARLAWNSYDLFYSLMKGVAFGFTIPLIAAHMGFHTHGGAEGVGRATTGAVVFMTLAILCIDALFPMILLNR